MKHNLFIRIIKDKNHFLRFSDNITPYEAGQIITLLGQLRIGRRSVNHKGEVLPVQTIK